MQAGCIKTRAHTEQLPPKIKEKRAKILREVASIHAQLVAVNAAVTVDVAIAALVAQRAAPPYATADGVACTLPQLYEALSARGGLARRQRTAVPGTAAAAEGVAAPA